MKKITIVAALLCLAASQPVFADEQVDSGDPCTVFFCMAGKLTGSGGSECNGPVKKFFSFNAFKKHHRFNPGDTFNMRKAFLGQCPSADPAYVSKILSKFGRMRG